MRIGELAAAVGVSTRTVRHYHRVGVLPEPGRTDGGYRDYGLRDLVRLGHARQLTDLGLGLGEVRRVLADEEGRALGDIIEAMDAELAVQQEQLAVRRRRLAELRHRVHDGRLAVDDLPEPELVEFFTRVEAAGATGPMARLDRDMLALLPGAQARDWVVPLLPLLADEAYTRRLVEVYDGMDRLADVEADDPAVTDLVERIMGLLPEESRRELATQDLESLAGEGVLDAVLAELPPAQVAAARELMARLSGSAPAGADPAHPADPTEPEEDR